MRSGCMRALTRSVPFPVSEPEGSSAIRGLMSPYQDIGFLAGFSALQGQSFLNAESVMLMGSRLVLKMCCETVTLSIPRCHIAWQRSTR